MMLLGIDDLKVGLQYLRDNPSFLVRAAVNTARLRVGIPIATLRWLTGKIPAGKGPKALEVLALPPALGVRATVNVMGTELHISAALHTDRVEITDEQLLFTARVKDLSVKAPPASPIAQMLMAMDLAKPGNLMAFMPMKLPALVEASDDRFVFDLLRMPKLSENAALRKLLSALSKVVSIKDVRTEGDLLVISLRAHPRGLPAALLGLAG